MQWALKGAARRDQALLIGASATGREMGCKARDDAEVFVGFAAAEVAEALREAAEAEARAAAAETRAAAAEAQLAEAAPQVSKLKQQLGPAVEQLGKPASMLEQQGLAVQEKENARENVRKLCREPPPSPLAARV